MMISINSKRTKPSQGTFNHRLTPAGLLLAVFAASLMLTACPPPNGGTPALSARDPEKPAPTGPSARDPEKPASTSTTPYARDLEKPAPTPTTPKPKARHVTAFAGNAAAGTNDGIGTAASFASLHSIAQSGDTLYVTDVNWHSIRTIDIPTAQVGTIVTANPVGGYVNGAGTSARFNAPRGIAVTDGDTLYVADSGNHRIREVRIDTSAAAQVSPLVGSGTPGHTDGASTDAQFDYPIGLALSGTTLYVADYNNHRIRAVDLASPEKTVSTIAGSGTPGNTDGAGAAARFNYPSDLAVSGTTLYVADYNNHRIRAIDLASPEKTVSTIAGSGTPGHADGAGIAAQFNTPGGLAVSGTTLYVADYDNHRIRAVDLASPEKTVSTIAGDGTAEHTNGIGTGARFSRPRSIAVRGSTLYVTSRTLIRKLEYREAGS